MGSEDCIEKTKLVNFDHRSATETGTHDMSECIERIEVHYLEIPLTKPYRLSFGPVDHYDIIIVELTDGAGRYGFGEATLLTGYTDETIAGSWTLAREVASELAGVSLVAFSERLNALVSRAPFTATAFLSALDMLSGHPELSLPEAVRIPVLGLLQGKDEAELSDNFERLLECGYQTIKVKVGFDVGADLQNLALIQQVVGGRAVIRVDANQGYTAAQAEAFIGSVDPRGIELFEQPCAAHDWVAHRNAVAAAAKTGLPLMLDESIYGLADIERAAKENACAYLKVKLMKFGSIDALSSAIERIRTLGMQPVLGNGVASDVSCWMEACVAARHIDNAGEMNGYLKARASLFEESLRFEQGHIVLDAALRPALNRDALAAHMCEHVAYRKELHACAPTLS